jgi:hypothetical protein
MVVFKLAVHHPQAAAQAIDRRAAQAAIARRAHPTRIAVHQPQLLHRQKRRRQADVRVHKKNARSPLPRQRHPPTAIEHRVLLNS